MTNNPKIAKFILSFDFEIGWGDVTNTRWMKREKNGVYDNLRIKLKELLNEMDALELPATWATVGAMISPPDKVFLDHLPDKAKKVVYATIKSAKASSFDGRDLFESLLQSKAKHSIASHSFSHVPFDFAGVNNKFIVDDLTLSLEALSRYGLTTDRFVFPENTEGYYPELAKTGFKVARVGANYRKMSRPMYLLSSVMKAPPASIEEVTKEGVIRHYGSMLFNMRAGKYHRLPFVYKQAMQGLSNACKERENFHVWAHPFNFAESTLQLTAFKTFLRKVAKRRDAGEIIISTM